ncbi:transcriptional regulator with XRE-family HTH domain [Kineosphaera limosa]|uniref:Putative Xre family DNA-binding protein n=1 Tax=Kineosphaera limosa NBRC 100340 TaxID=1184609 RepID=K6WML7_9MICO|nr:XRE family transcriptional regulator [Kineosphaera limosa]NYE00483.1 transcriptional regulator with XRE-family HTH domain [Kineosphaera limosa]GAB95051.1 putative Xre family DNA-binding protein [Kineosphaera limosa NBRC 100340]
MKSIKSLPVQQSAPEPAIGIRLRLARQNQRLTVEELAEATGVSKGYISRVERDLTMPSIPNLLLLCQALRIDVAEVFATTPVQLMRLADAPTVDLGGTGIEERLVTPVHERRLQILRSTVAPGGHSEAEPYGVDSDLEAVHVISGQFALEVDGTEYVLHAGDTLTFPGQSPHRWHNPADEPAVVLWALAG